jgi:hemoglobin
MTIYDAIGGSAAVAATVDSFYERVLADPHLTHYFEGVDIRRLKGHQRGFIAAAIGGPELYTGRSMREAHAKLHIRPEHFDLVVGHLVDTMTSLNVPDSIIGQIGATLTPLRDEIAPALADTATRPEDASLDAAS